jgi:hypothetical protein
MKSKRSYPPLFEKLVPIAIGLLLIVVIGLLIFTIAVGVGVPGF